jgi:phosphoglycolate phosphatase-like HAD superfamily hydrolase
MKRLLLWDIDGTLIRGNGVGTEVLYAAASVAADRAIERGEVALAGKCDPRILREIFEEAEIAAHEIDALIPTAMAEAERLLAEAEVELRRRGHVIDGVVEALTALDAVDGVRQTLLTGNLAGNAALKVAAFDLGHFFDVEIGAYGTDHEDRNALVPVARQRAEDLRGERYADDEVWVIGDTPNDLACARTGGVPCLLVATGDFDASTLKQLEPDVLFDDLTDTETVVATLSGRGCYHTGCG